MSITERSIKEQLPSGAQKETGNTKDVAGVIDERIYTEQDVLLNQAQQIARARRGVAVDGGANFSDDFVKEHMVRAPKEMLNRNLNADTIQMLQQGQINRDQQYVGNNTDWTGYYLEPLSKFVVPFDTPVRNMLPRTACVGIDAINWRAITDVFGGNGPAISNYILPQQTAPLKTTYNWVNKSNLLRQIAISDIVTFETELYGKMFEPDVRAKVAAKLAPTLMIGQEYWYLNSGQQCWSPAPVSGVSTSTSGGSITAATNWIIVTAVNAQGESLAWSIAPASVTTPQAVSVVTSGTTSTITFNINRVPGATSYNVYMGTGSTQPANSAMWLQAATKFGGSTALNDPGGLASGYFSVTMTGVLATSGTAYSSIITSNAPTTPPYMVATGSTPSGYILTFDGFQALAMTNAGSLSTVGVGGETAAVKRVADAGGVLAKSDIDNWLESMYLNARANPECLLVSVKDHKAISNIVAQSSNFRVNTAPTQAGLSDLVGGARATKWINQTTGRLMDIIMCPYLMQGTIIALSLTLPFSVAEIDKPPCRVEVNREMWAIEYPPDQSHPTQWMYGAYTSESLVHQYLGGLGMLTGIVTS